MSLLEDQNQPWFWDENVPGQGTKPDFLNPKYKTIAEQAKAQRELEGRLGLAPNEYDFTKGKEWVEPNFEHVKEMANYAKSKHVPQDVMDKVMETVNIVMNKGRIDPATEKAKLGANADERLTILNNWAKSNFSETAYKALDSSLKSADAIMALEEVRNKMLSNTTTIPNSNVGAESGGITMEQYRAELQTNYMRYKNDPAYRKEMEKKLESIVGNKG